VALFLWDETTVVKKMIWRYGKASVIAIVNGEERTIGEGNTIADLLAELALGGRRIAVELNRDIVPAAEYRSRAIREGDQIEIVQFVGGG
jgi:sulfur carrier protein